MPVRSTAGAVLKIMGLPDIFKDRNKTMETINRADEREDLQNW
jgi:hypothetical protein